MARPLPIQVVEGARALIADEQHWCRGELARDVAAVGGKDVPALFFGATKMNNNVAVVDEVAKTGKGYCGNPIRERRRSIRPGSDNCRKAGQKRTGDWDRFGTPALLSTP